MGVSPRVLENSSCQGDWKQFLDPATGEVGMKGRTLWLTCVLVVLVLGACSEDRITSPEPVDSGVPMPSTSALQLSQQETPDPNQVARAVPGFAGYFLDGGSIGAGGRVLRRRRGEQPFALRGHGSLRPGCRGHRGGRPERRLRRRAGFPDRSALDAPGSHPPG